jgi:decaprenylphospho-beta-D-erythro-pentofuranosid-2-ulose 2-reductase
MTEGLDAAPFATTPDVVADAMVGALTSNAQVVWVPGALRFVFGVLRNVPQAAWRRLPG